MSRHRHVGRMVKGELEAYDEDEDYYDEDESYTSTSSSSSSTATSRINNTATKPLSSVAHFTTKPLKTKQTPPKPAAPKPSAALPPPHPPTNANTTNATSHSRTPSIPAGFNAGDYADDDYIPGEEPYGEWEEGGVEEEWEEEDEAGYDEYDSAVTYKQPAAATAPKPKQAAKATPTKGKSSTASTPARTPSPFTAAAPPKPSATPPPAARIRTAAEDAETAAAVDALRMEKIKLSNSPSLPRLSSAAGQHELSLSRTNSPAPSTPTSASSSSLPSSASGTPSLLRASSSTEQLAAVALHKRQQSRLAMVQAEDQKETAKPTLNVVVIGHVDAGKSTLMGHLLLLMGVVSAKTLHKYEKDSRALGKASFHFAWVLDQQDEERQRGITVDVAISHFDTASKHITLLDAPGHRDFIPNMIAGTAQADVAVLVVPAVVGEFEAGFMDNAQIREHAMLAKSMGVGQLVVAVNKCDVVGWEEERYRQILAQLLPFLKSTGYKDTNITTVPVSGLTGENITERTDARLSSWYSGPTLLAAIDALTPPKRPIDRPFRCCVTEVFRSQSLGVTVAGRVDSGAVIKGDSVLVLPQGETVSVRGVEVNGEQVAVGRVGENVEVGLKDLTDPALLIPGSWLCDPHHPIPLTQRFRAQILTTALSRVLLSGTNCIMYTQSAAEEVTLAQLVAVLDSRDGRVVSAKPRLLGRGVTAVVEVVCKRQICIELYKEYRELGRFSLRRGTETVAVGIVQEIF